MIVRFVLKKDEGLDLTENNVWMKRDWMKSESVPMKIQPEIFFKIH